MSDNIRELADTSYKSESYDEAYDYYSRLLEENPEEHEKKCPDCAEYIKLEARICKHCGHEFSDEEVEQQIEEIRRDGEEQRGEKPMLYCERSEISVQPNLDGTTCPACGENIDDRRHPTLEEAGE